MMAHMMNVFKSYQEYSPCALIVLAWLIMTVCAHFHSDVSSIWWEMSRRRHEYWLSKMQCKIKLEPLFADLRTHQNSWYVVTFNMLWELFIPIFYLLHRSYLYILPCILSMLNCNQKAINSIDSWWYHLHYYSQDKNNSRQCRLWS